MIVLDSKCNDGYEKMLLALVRSRYESDKFFEDACKKTARDVPGLFKYVKDQARKQLRLLDPGEKMFIFEDGEVTSDEEAAAEKSGESSEETEGSEEENTSDE